jgi:2-hydroxychromene-2-carboxylate isomerase
MTPTRTVPVLDGGPHDIEYFFDPACPFAWQTSQWIRRVVDLRGISVGWRFASLKLLNEGSDQPPEMTDAHHRGLRYLRICAAARAEHGNRAVGDLYRAWGERFWYVPAEGELGDRLAVGAEQVDPAEILDVLGLPDSLLRAADETSCDEVIRAETDEAIRRTGPDVGTPIITYDPPDGNSLFGPIISEVPDDETALAFYDAMRTLVDIKAFSEIKRTDRAPLDLPLLAEAS